VTTPPGPQPEPRPDAHRDPHRDPRLDLRVSHDDRERVVERLRQAAGEGRLDIDELEERLERAFAARTYGDLQPLLRDIPGNRPDLLPAAAYGAGNTALFSTGVGGTPTVYRSQAVFGEQRREGAWVVPATYTATAVLGNVLLDLRAATFAEPRVTISCNAFMGEIKIRVGPDVTVVDEVNTVLAEARQRSSRDLPPVPQGGPVLYVRGTVVMSELTVERLAPGERKVRRWRRGQITP
jgi:Domain of unknown function (DUF1707)